MMQEFLLFLVKRGKLFVINFILISLVAWAYAWFIAKKEYQAQVTFLPPAGETASPLSLMGIPLPSLSGSSIMTEQIETIFHSKAIKRRIIDQFDFYTIFKLTKNINKFELAIKNLRNYLMLSSVERGSMGFEKIVSYTITCYHPSPDTAKMMSEFAFFLLDSSVRNVSMSRALRNRTFIEDQLILHKAMLDSLQKAFEAFQVANKAYVIPEQLKLSLKAYSELKSAAILNELKIKTLEREFRGPLPELEELRKMARLYNEKLAQLESEGEPDVLPSLGLSTKLLPQHSNLVREIEVRNEVILMLERELEQARLQESKDISSLVVVDAPFVPEYKSRPKRLVLIAGIVAIEHLLLIILLSYHFYFSTVFMRHEKIHLFLRALKNKE
ncbi:MAG: hypothetical protein JW768_02425 [Chitinispirillaceae bacterium]|nr:hypothetical protein [Chitinispirillaceae bacterium]